MMKLFKISLSVNTVTNTNTFYITKYTIQNPNRKTAANYLIKEDGEIRSRRVDINEIGNRWGRKSGVDYYFGMYCFDYIKENKIYLKWFAEKFIKDDIETIKQHLAWAEAITL